MRLGGVMQAPGGPQEDPAGGFALSGWTALLFDEALGAFMARASDGRSTCCPGCKPYDIFAAHWPYVTDPGEQPIAEGLNRATGSR